MIKYYIKKNDNNFITLKYVLKGTIDESGIEINESNYNLIPDNLKVGNYYISKYENSSVIVKTLQEWVDDGEYVLDPNETIIENELMTDTLDDYKLNKINTLREIYQLICENTDSEWLKYNKRVENEDLYEGDEQDKDSALLKYKNATITYKDLKSQIENSTSFTEVDSIDLSGMDEYL